MNLIQLNAKSRIHRKDSHTREQYQDIVINGQLISEGSCDCQTRYKGLKPLLENFKRKFTVLDIGAAQGFFSFKIAHEYDAVTVMIEGDHTGGGETADQLLGLCKENTALDNIIYLKKHISVEELERLAECEYFDVVLALNMVHHFGKDWKRALDAIFKLGNYIVIEIPPSTDKAFAHNEQIKTCERYLDQKGGTGIAQTPRHTDQSAISSMRLYEINKESISHKHWLFGSSAKKLGLQYKVESNFQKKIFIKEKANTIIARPWIPGINLITFKMLNGQWPNKLHISKELVKFDQGTHEGVLPWNMIIQGNRIESINNNSEFYADQ